MILSNDGLVAFHYRSYGTFFLHKIGSIISIGDLPTTNIIEPKNLAMQGSFFAIKSERVPFLQFHKIMVKWLNIKFGEKYEVQAYRI